jgi:hypothetical protein
VSKQVNEIQWLYRFRYIDDRKEEFFYTQAAYNHGINKHPFRECDVFLKKMRVRQDLLFRLLAKYRRELDAMKQESTPDDFFEAMKCWCNFWDGAEKVLNSLVDVHPGVRKIQPLEKGRITDRRRFGELFTEIGRMFMLVAQSKLSDWYWNAKKMQREAIGLGVKDGELHIISYIEKKYKSLYGKRASKDVLMDFIEDNQSLDKESAEEYCVLLKRRGGFKGESEVEKLEQRKYLEVLCERLDLERAANAIDRIFGFLIDNVEFEQGLGEGRIDANICEKETIGINSPLWNLSSTSWRGLSEARLSRLNWWPQAMRVPGCGAEKNRDAYKKRFESKIKERKLHSLLLSDKPACVRCSLLASHNAFLVGQLYYTMKCIFLNWDGERGTLGKGSSLSSLEKKWLPRIRTLYRAEVALLGAYLSLDNSLRDVESAESSRSLGMLYLGCIESLLKFRSDLMKAWPKGGTKHNRLMMDRNLAMIYTYLHISSKRFLVNAEDAYLEERMSSRVVHQALGSCFRAKGDLMIIRAEILAFNEEKIFPERGTQKESDKEDMETLAGIDGAWKDVNRYIGMQDKYTSDDEARDTRREAAEAYRKACSQHLSEIEEYKKRYRITNETFYVRKNLMNRKLHYEI